MIAWAVTLGDDSPGALLYAERQYDVDGMQTGPDGGGYAEESSGVIDYFRHQGI